MTRALLPVFCMLMASCTSSISRKEAVIAYRAHVARVQGDASFYPYLETQARLDADYLAADAPLTRAQAAGKPVSRARPLYKTPLSYPASARSELKEAYLYFGIVIDSIGLTRKVIYLPHPGLPADPEFIASGRQTLEHWTYTPCTIEGVAVMCTGIMPVSFQLAPPPR